MLAELLVQAQDQPADSGQVGWLVGLGATSTVVLTLGGLVMLARAVRGWVRAQAAQVATSNGRTLGQLVEGTAADMTAVRSELSTLNGVSVENREIATSALALARHTGERLDAHLAGHGKEET